ncbi:C39 family peptidase [Bacillus sp. MRMR6]|uniref:C39 family peptidase n=1 Tax=Bacillus sp. MRMR6 TaxID=1928617 RepID=UPI000951EDD6|nr:C39 family peptidase [Bacillus sp. MRMR6]OLS41927.1 peptidase C39 [Bacillus sp. MRMR6]
MKKLCFMLMFLLLFGCSNTETASITKPSTKSDNLKKEQAATPPEKVNPKTPEGEVTNLPPKPMANVKNTTAPANKKESMMLDVALIKQNPELRYGCEVTSLAMVLNYAGVNTNKMELYQAVRKDLDPLKKSNTGDIISWGNPAEGFVGDMTGKTAGYAVFDKPMIDLINQKLPGRAVNLTNQPFDAVLDHVSKGFPVVVWTTGDYRLPDRWEQWNHGSQVIKTPLDLHAVVLVGYDKANVYLNDPLSGKKQVAVNKERFIASWKALESRAVSYQ